MKLKYLNSLYLFKKAYEITRREIGVSLVILLFMTIIFAVVMWIAEHSTNDAYTLWDALVWTIVKYIDDPADVAMAPQTILGQVVGTMVGILGIAIFAVPAGLVGSGLISAIEEQKEEEKTAKNSLLLHKRFRRIAQSASWFANAKGLKVTLKGVPRFRSMDDIRVKLGLTEDEIIAAVNNCPDMRLMNMASTKRVDDNPQDRIVVVHFPLNREYGCFIDRGSDVTIVAPAAVTELGTGNFAFSLAALGGFNYVSKELTPTPVDPFGFYTMQKSKLGLIGDYDIKEDVESQALHFMDDLRGLKHKSEAAGRKHWFIFIMATTKSSDCQMHLWRLATDSKRLLPRLTVGGVEYGSTVLSDSEQTLQNILQAINATIGQRNVSINGSERPIEIRLDDNNILKSVSRSNIMCRMGGGVECNALTVRISYEVLVYHSAHLLIARDLAKALKDEIEPDRELTAEDKRCFMEEGDGYADQFGKMDIFNSDPEALRQIIESESRGARQRFEHLDLDGNVEKVN